MSAIDQALLPTFVAQHGLVNLEDIRRCGGGHHTVYPRLATGSWERAEDGVYRLVGFPWTWHSELLAPILTAGPEARASHHAAAALYDLPGFGRGVPELTVPRGSGFRRKAMRVHTSTDLGRSTRRVVEGVPATDPARTMLDLARVVSDGKLLRTIEAGRRAALLDWSSLVATLARHARPGRPGIRRLRRVILANASRDEITDSDLELLGLSLFREHGLPEPVLHYRVMSGDRFIAEVDLAYPELRIAIELDGSIHREREVHERDLPRQNDLILAGWTVLRFTWRRLTESPEQVAAEIRTAIRRATALAG